MKTQLNVMALVLTMIGFFAVNAHAANPQAKVLDDAALASVKGGFCIFDQCESGRSGVCQPFPDTAKALCATVTCVFNDEIDGNIVVMGCSFAGKTTCSNASNYRQCIQVYFFHLCTQSGSTPCGDEVEPVCHASEQDRACICQIQDTGSACDWTDCNL